jgi:hypothetical protein
LKDYLTPLFATVTGLSFALGGTVTEFIAACQFVFFKQPYDVGDRVVIETKELIVEKICLLHTIFHRNSDGAVESIAHSKIRDLWITNLSRSKILSIKEVVILLDNSDILTRRKLAEHSKGLAEFIREDRTRGRYLDAAEFKLETEWIGDMRQQVIAHIKLHNVVVRHESVLARALAEVREKVEDLIDQRLTSGDIQSVQRSTTI